MIDSALVQRPLWPFTLLLLSGLCGSLPSDPSKPIPASLVSFLLYRTLVHLYHAEANLRLDKVSVAVQTLEEYLKGPSQLVRLLAFEFPEVDPRMSDQARTGQFPK